MEEISVEQGIQLTLTSLLADRLAFLAGAGLSMAAPSNLSSAAALARAAKTTYDARFSPPAQALSLDIEEQAQYFFERGELSTVYLRTLVDANAFAGTPNAGHYCVADLLLVHAIQTAITTNVDTMVETAGQLLFGQIEAVTNGLTAARCRPNTTPFLKLHGCRNIDWDNTVWAPGQLSTPPVNQYIADSELWLRGRLMNRDLLVVGFSTDWDYLNNLLSQTIGAANPASVIVVNPSTADEFIQKAPELYLLGESVGVNFKYVRGSGADFLDKLRESFSKSFIRQVLASGCDVYRDTHGVDPEPAWTQPSDLPNQVLWNVRRDLEGRLPNQPAQHCTPKSGVVLGLTLLQLRAIGAVADDIHWVVGDTRVRVFCAEGGALHQVEAAFARNGAPPLAPDIVIAVGAEDLGLPSDIVRDGAVGSIARGSASRWITRMTAIEEFGLQ